MQGLNKSLISVIVPVYNVEIYLSKCLDSIINQTYKQLEIIVINDGSTDRSAEICEHYAMLDSRVKVFHQSNSGISVVRNRGIDISTGKYFLFVDSDDFLSLDIVEHLFEAMLSSKAQISIGHLKTITEDGSILLSKAKSLGNYIHHFTTFDAIYAMYDHQYSYSLSFVVVTGKIYEASLFDGLRFPVGKAYDDEFINYRLLLKASRIVYMPKAIYYYLIRANSLTRLEYSLSKLDRIFALEERIEILKNMRMKSLVKITQYMYFRDLINHISKIAKHFSNEIEIQRSLGNKFNEVGIILLIKRPISLKSHLFIALRLIMHNFSNLFLKKLP